MSEYVVDASIAAKWYLPEVHADAARRLTTGSHTLHAPDLLYPEFTNILWKRVRRADMSEAEAAATVHALLTVPLQVHPSAPLIPVALEIACRTGRTAYDSLYLALAVRENIVLVMADERLYNAIHGGPLSSYLLWVEDVP